MSIFYDPHKRKPKIWVTLVFIAVPILLIIFFYLGSRPFITQATEKQQVENTETDIFAK